MILQQKNDGGEENKNTKNTVLILAWSAYLIKMQYPGISTMYVLVSAVKNSFFSVWIWPGLDIQFFVHLWKYV